MTNSEYIEELLIKSHSLGIQDEVYELSRKLREKDGTLDFIGSIEKAYFSLTK